MLLGGCTCFGLHGSTVACLTSSHPLGPYTPRSSVLDPGCDISATRDCYDVGPKAATRTHCQTSFTMTLMHDSAL